MSRHTKRIPAPRTWPIHRKANTFVLKPLPGKHSEDYALPVAVVLRDLLHYVDTVKEAKLVLMQKKVLVDGKPVREPKHNVGLLDVISLPGSDEHYLILINQHNKLYIKKINKNEAKTKVVKIVSKKLLSKDKFQYGTMDGRTIVSPDKYNTYDSLILGLPDQKIIKVLPFTLGNIVYMMSGNHVGKYGVLKEIVKGENTTKIIVESKDGAFETLKKYAIIIGEKKPEMPIE